MPPLVTLCCPASLTVYTEPQKSYGYVVWRKPEATDFSTSVSMRTNTSPASTIMVRFGAECRYISRVWLVN